VLSIQLPPQLDASGYLISSQGKEVMMKLKEALKDTSIVEGWYDGFTAVVVKESEGYRLSIQQGNKPPYLTLNVLSLEQVEKEVAAMHPSHPIDWSPVELEG
jgi:hypothetical protein